MKKTLVSLVGEQPVPNLLPIRHYKPEMILLVCSEFTEKAANRFARLVKDETQLIKQIKVDAYDIASIQQAISEDLDQLPKTEDVIFNITGGTKPMSLAAFLVAKQRQNRFCYLQSEGKKSRLLAYHMGSRNNDPNLELDSTLNGLITINDYLNAYLDSYQHTGFAKTEPGKSFEEAIYKVLQPAVDEVLNGVSLLNALEIDFVVRCENQVGIIEAKTGKKALAKEGIDQLNTAGGRSYLGTYTQKFFIIDRQWTERSNLRELAQARNIHLIEVPSYSNNGSISESDALKIQETVTKILGK